MNVTKKKLGHNVSVTVDDGFKSIKLSTDGERAIIYAFDGNNHEWRLPSSMLSMLRCALAIGQYAGDDMFILKTTYVDKMIENKK